jgi:hypothetical protein
VHVEKESQLTAASLDYQWHTKTRTTSMYV